MAVLGKTPNQYLVTCVLIVYHVYSIISNWINSEPTYWVVLHVATRIVEWIFLTMTKYCPNMHVKHTFAVIKKGSFEYNSG